MLHEQRDRIKAVASKFKLGSHKPSVPPAAPSSGSANDFNAANNVYLEGVYEPVSSSGLTDHHESTADEDGGNHYHAAQHRVAGRKESVTSMAVSTTSMASDATGPTVAGFFGNKNKRDSMDAGLKKRSSLTSWTTGKKRSSRPSTASSFDSSNEIPAENKLGSNGGNSQLGSGQKASGISGIYPFSGFRSNETTPTSSRRNSQVGLTLDHSAVVERIEEEDHTIPPKPRPEQAAYIRRLLNGPNLPPRATDDPLERLRNGMAQMPISPGAPGGLPGNDAHHLPETTATANHQPTIEGLETDLMDSLRNFTAVEVLEGDNAFACHKCWRYKTGRGGRRRRELARLANMAHAPAAGETSSSSDSEDGAATPAKRNSVAFVDPRKIPEIAVTTDDEPANPSIAANDVSVPNGSLTANRSPRPSSTSSVEADMLTVLSSASGRSNSGTSGYQTSSEDSSDEAPVGRLSVVRPPPPQRRKSQHFVLQRAFKRYMIARAPPVLVFHFKRFQQSSKQAASNMYSGSFAALKKIDDFVSFPERIDLSPFLAPNRQDYKVVIGEDGVGRADYHSHPAGDTGPELIPMRYRLYGELRPPTIDRIAKTHLVCCSAVVVHLGLTAISGHYVCYVLVDPGMIIKSKAPPSTSAEPVEAQDVTCEPDMAAVAVADPSDGTSTSPHPVDNRVWCYCSE
jgi:ubiquitin carboxyl-terminal hydrolase 16/45